MAPAATSETAEAEVRAVVERWAQAVRDGDLAGILARHPDDVVMFDVPPPLRHDGLAAYERTWEVFFRYSRGGPGSFDLVDLHVVAGADVAFGHALLVIDGGAPLCRLTLGLERRDGEWWIVHEHHSAPASPPAE